MKRLALLFALLALSCGSNDSTGDASGGSGGSAGSGGSSTGGTSGSGGSAGSSGGSAGAADCLAKAQGVTVADVDLDGFPSYSVDGCQLAYVSASDKSLILRDLQSGAESSVAPAAENPRRPTLSGGVLAWEADVLGKSAVRVRHGGQIATVTGSFDHAGEPRATADAVVLTGWLGALADGDTDVFLYSTSDKSVKLVAGGSGQQRFADVSATHVAVSDFSEDPSGVYSGDGTTLADIIVVERATGGTTAKKGAGKQAFPMLGSAGTLAYLEWLAVHPVPKLQEYTIVSVPIGTLGAAGLTIGSVQSEQAVRPTATAGVAEWVVRWGGESSLWRAALDGSSAPAKQNLGTAKVLHAPSSSASMTVLAVEESAGSAPALVAIPR